MTCRSIATESAYVTRFGSVDATDLMGLANQLLRGLDLKVVLNQIIEVRRFELICQSTRGGQYVICVYQPNGWRDFAGVRSIHRILNRKHQYSVRPDGSAGSNLNSLVFRDEMTELVGDDQAIIEDHKAFYGVNWDSERFRPVLDQRLEAARAMRQVVGANSV